ncbi:protein AF-10 isoform X7 [Engraulis encrasicolus]|uniref:protein AF-10 isoform X7 n=1 Tax=Engraulis encrasicolus TaxID=184585 RepID=UPI002FD6B586
MVSSELYLAVEDDYFANNMKEMIGGCCVCSDERGWAENPLVYCDGHGCNVAVHQACYGIVQVPTGPWFCRKCESQERAARVRCELCPHKDGALKRTDNGGWAHVVCALYIPEVEFANVSTMEPIVLQSVPHERYNKTCYICEEQGRESKAATGACMTCNKHGCRQAFHVTCAQFAELLCEEQGSDADNVKYCGYCKYHYSKLRRSKGRGSRAQSLSHSSSQSEDKHHDQDSKDRTVRESDRKRMGEREGKDRQQTSGMNRTLVAGIMKHKERDRHKPKHKKSMELSPPLMPPHHMVSSEKSFNSSSSSSGSGGGGGGSISSMSTAAQKRLDDASGARFTTANFQEVSAHSGGGSSAVGGGAKDSGSTAEAKVAEGNKSKKANSHCAPQRGRKSATGKPLVAVVTTAATSSTSSCSPFQQSLMGSTSIKTSASSSSSSSSSSTSSVVQPPADFQSFSEAAMRAAGGDSSYSAPTTFARLAKSERESAAPSEGGGVSLGTFGTMISLPAGATVTSSSTSSSSSSSSALGGGKHFESVHGPPGDLGALASAATASAAGFKRSQPSATGTTATAGEEMVKGKKKRGNWRNRYGPCFSATTPPPPPEPKMADASEHGTPPSGPSSSSSGPTPPSSALSGNLLAPRGSSNGGGAGGGMGVGEGLGVQRSVSLLRNGSLQGLGVGSVASGPGAFSSGDVAGSGAGSDLPHQQQATSASASSLAPPAPFSSTPLTAASTANTLANPLAGPAFNLAPPHMFGNRLNPNSSMAALIAQSENTTAESEQGDATHGFPRKGASPKATLSPRSPLVGGLHIRYDASSSSGGALGPSDSVLPPVATSLQQLLERQWSDGQQFLLQHGAQGDVVGMLKSLHQLQQENRRLEDQIRTLTMRKERLQLLSAQLSVPFTSTASPASPHTHPNHAHTDMLGGSKLGGGMLTDPTQPTQDSLGGVHGAHSSSGGSTSSLSTPPSVSHSPPQQPGQINGVGVALGAGGAMPSAMLGGAGAAGVPVGLMGALQGAQAGGGVLGMSGIVGALNGVIHTSGPALGQNASPLQQQQPHGTPTANIVTSGAMPINSGAATGKSSVSRLGQMTAEQQRLILQRQQIQHLLNAPQNTQRLSEKAVAASGQEKT